MDTIALLTLFYSVYIAPSYITLLCTFFQFICFQAQAVQQKHQY